MILNLVIHDRGVVEDTSLQALTLARELAAQLGEPLHAVWIGAESSALETVGAHGAALVQRVDHAALDDYCPGGWAEAVAQLVASTQPVAVVAAGSDRGNEVMAHLGAILGLPMVANCREVTPGDPWTILRTRWGGSLFEETTLDAPIRLLTVAEHVVEAVSDVDPVLPPIVSFQPTLTDTHLLTKVVDRDVTAEGVTLATAPVVVSGGRGVGGPEGFGPLEELAALLGGVVGCSRVVTNNGWRPHTDQVGQTGTVVAPDLYIACGISGAIQHWVGMMASKTILAINTDAEAPMVTKADYAILGDLSDIVPAIVEELSRRRGVDVPS
jgi:electron transfer flavoprotein alpha subunit